MIGTHHNGPKPYRGMKLGRRRLAEAIVNGRTYTTISRMAPANEIARQLVADGVPNAPMHVYTAGLKGCLMPIVPQDGRHHVQRECANPG